MQSFVVPKGLFISTVLLLGVLLGQETGSNVSTNAASTNAEGPVKRMDTLFVSANRFPTPYSLIGSTVSVLNRTDLDRLGLSKMKDAVNTLPAVSIAQNGPMGGLSSMFLRGGNSSSVLMLLDGVSLADPSSPGRQASFSHLPSYLLERVEVVKGSQSILYGSDALSGVVFLTSRLPSENPFSLELEVEGGSYGMFNQHLSASGKIGWFSYLLSGIVDNSLIGFNKVVVTNNSRTYDADKYFNTSLLARLTANPLKNLSLYSVTTFDYNKTDLDAGSFQDDTNSAESGMNFREKMGVEWSVGKWFRHQASFQIDTFNRTNADPDFLAYNALYLGNKIGGATQFDFLFLNHHQILVGGEYNAESMKNTDNFGTFLQTNQDLFGIYAQYGFSLKPYLSATAGLRYDNVRGYSPVLTYRFTGAGFIKPIGLKIHASLGTGYKAPSLYQLHSFYGRSNLSPETSFSWDAGAEESLLNDRLRFGATYFHTDYQNLINYFPQPFPLSGYYTNTSKVETRGVEVEAGVRILDFEITKIDLNAGYTFTDARDVTAGTNLALIRRPYHKGNVGVSWTLAKKMNIGFNLGWQGESTDLFYNSSTFATSTVTNQGFAKLDANISFQVLPWLRPYLRLENILNQTYSTIYGYAEPGISLYGGVRVNLDFGKKAEPN